MNEKNNPITLSRIQLTTYCAADEVASARPGVELFDGRRDFTINSALSGLAVLLTLTDERRLLSSPLAPGASRTVSVTLIDGTAGAVMGTESVAVEVPDCDYIAQCRVDFPLACADVNTEHTFRLVVRDECSRRLLGEDTFRMYDEVRGGRHVSDWFAVERGGVSDFSDDLYRSIDYPGNAYHKVVFMLRMAVDDAPVLLPEMEVRVHYPGGGVDARFARPVRDRYDAGLYVVEVPFLAYLGRRGVHYAELLCMDFPLAGMVFSTDYDYIGGAWEDADLACLDTYSPDAAVKRFHEAMGVKEAVMVEREDDDDDEFERLLDDFISTQSEPDADADDDEPVASELELPQPRPAELTLDGLTGLRSVKEKLAVYDKLVQFSKMRRDCNLPSVSLPLHAMFVGSPGTGKTTVAKIIGKMLADAGVLSSGHVVVRERSMLMGPVYSSEEKNTLDAIAEAQGGILLIDEAYQLYQPADPRDPGRLVIETLMTAMADESKRDWMLILAGYPDEMRRMFEMNPGLKSRIPDSNIYEFDDFSEAELMEIAERYLSRNSYRLSAGAYEALRARMADDYRRRDRSFGNARHVLNLLQTEVLPAMAMRVVSGGGSGVPAPEALMEILPADIPAPVRITQPLRPRIGYCA